MTVTMTKRDKDKDRDKEKERQMLIVVWWVSGTQCWWLIRWSVGAWWLDGLCAEVSNCQHSNLFSVSRTKKKKSEVLSNTSPQSIRLNSNSRIFTRLWLVCQFNAVSGSDSLLVGTQQFSSILLPCHLTGLSCWQCRQRQRSGPSVEGCFLPAPLSRGGFSSNRCGPRETEPERWTWLLSIGQKSLLI